MNNQNLDGEDILKNSIDTDEIIVNTDSYEDNVEDSEDDIDFLKEKLNKLESAYENQKRRAEKAEAQAKTKPAERAETSKQSRSGFNELTPFDLMAVSKAELDEEGLTEVMDFARYKKISVSEALKSPIMKAALAEKAENRRIAEATNTGSGRRGNSRISDEALLDSARSGNNLPDSEADIRRLVQARMKNR